MQENKWMIMNVKYLVYSYSQLKGEWMYKSVRCLEVRL